MSVSERHYLQLTDDFYEAAAKSSADSSAVAIGNGLQTPAANEKASAEIEAIIAAKPATNCTTMQSDEVRLQGLEPWTYGLKVPLSPDLTVDCTTHCDEAESAPQQVPQHSDANLSRLVELWPTLSDTTKRRIMAEAKGS